VAQAVSLSEVRVGIHAHNDSELAVANSLAAVEAGATHVQGTVNGYGERCGNANLISIIGNLALKLGRPQPQPVSGLREVSRYVDERANLISNARAPYVGDAAFAHKGGVHVAAVAKLPRSYEHVEPEAVGNRRRVLVSDLSGRANVMSQVAGEDDARAVVARIKELENQGYAFEGAEASVNLLARKVSGEHRPYFQLHGFKVAIDKRDDGREPDCEATVKVEVGGRIEHTAATGDGPVNALDVALLKALTIFYPNLLGVELIDYKVRVLAGSEAGTASVVRVVVEMTDGASKWSTVGVSTNIIEASYEALVDAYEFKLLSEHVAPLVEPSEKAVGARLST
ncbi:MAG: citramalate synthase, partial [Trueperaceae bacterium]|nr:citramalate synthase [Trueperaceae bacterium]